MSDRLERYKQIAADRILKMGIGERFEVFVLALSKVLQLEDELVCTFIAPTEDVQADIAKLVQWEIQVHEDPAVSPDAAAWEAHYKDREQALLNYMHLASTFALKLIASDEANMTLSRYIVQRKLRFVPKWWTRLYNPELYKAVYGE